MNNQVTISGYNTDISKIVDPLFDDDIPSLGDIEDMANASDLLSAADMAELDRLEAQNPEQFTRIELAHPNVADSDDDSEDIGLGIVGESTTQTEIIAEAMEELAEAVAEAPPVAAPEPYRATFAPTPVVPVATIPAPVPVPVATEIVEPPCEPVAAPETAVAISPADPVDQSAAEGRDKTFEIERTPESQAIWDNAFETMQTVPVAPMDQTTVPVDPPLTPEARIPSFLQSAAFVNPTPTILPTTAPITEPAPVVTAIPPVVAIAIPVEPHEDYVDDPNYHVESKAPERVGSVAGRYIPEGIPNVVGMTEEAEAIGVALDLNLPLILIGHTGLAKTMILAKEHEARNWPYRSITCNGAVEVDALIGKWTANPKEGMVYKLGILPFCMKYGISLGIQEINVLLPEVLILLHEYVDEGHITLLDLDPTHPDFIIKPHKNFRLFGTMNPPEMYQGARELSPALARRCIVRRVDHLSVVEEEQVVREQAAVVDDTAAKLVAVGQSVRESYDQGKTMYYMSTADLIMWGRLMTAGKMSPVTAAKLAVIGKAAESDQEFLMNVIRLQFDPSYVAPTTSSSNW